MSWFWTSARPRAVARFVLWPTALTDVIVPLEISGSMDGAAWRRLGVAPERVAQPAFVVGTRPVFRPRNGWLELVIAPQTVRYLRVRPAEPGSVGVGMVGELFAYEALDAPAAGEADMAALLRLLQTRGVTRLLADPVVSARVALATGEAVATLPANGTLNSHGFAPPAPLFARLRLRATDAGLVMAEDADDLRVRLASAGISVAAEPMGPYVLFQQVGPRSRQPAAGPPTGASRPRPPSRTAGARATWSRGASRPPRASPPSGSSTPGSRLATRRSRGSRCPTTARPGGRSTPRPLGEWAWAGRTLFAFASGISELVLDGASGRAVRVEVRLLYRGAGAIGSLCVREA